MHIETIFFFHILKALKDLKNIFYSQVAEFSLPQCIWRSGDKENEIFIESEGKLQSFQLISFYVKQ